MPGTRKSSSAVSNHGKSSPTAAHQRASLNQKCRIMYIYTRDSAQVDHSVSVYLLWDGPEVEREKKENMWDFLKSK